MSPLKLAWLNLVHQRTRTLISLAGVSFAIILIFMQLGFLGSVDRTATLLLDRLDFDLFLASAEYSNMNLPGTFPRNRLAQARAGEGVDVVLPISIGSGMWRDPRPLSDLLLEPRRWRLLILALQPGDLSRAFREVHPPTFRTPQDVTAYERALSRRKTVLIDRTSWPEFGTPHDRQPGSTTELNEIRVEIVGDFEIGMGFGYNGLLITSEDTLYDVTDLTPKRTTFGLVKLKPGTNLIEARNSLKRVLPDDVQVLTRAEINGSEERYWIRTTAVGQIFTMGVGVALMVGAIFVYQMMASDIRNHLPEYATFKAIGYTGSFLSQIVVAQAVLLALLSYGPSIVVSLGLYELTRRAAHLPIGMTIERAVSVLALIIVMCLCSGILAVRKVYRANPADLY